jgi:hypothetical protein
MIRVILLVACSLFCLPPLASGMTWQVPPWSIEYAFMFASPGDTVLIACGTYSEGGLHMTVPVTMRSESGAAACVVIGPWRDDTIIYCDWSSGAARIEDVTFTGGWGPASGAVHLSGAADVTFSRCAFVGNVGGQAPGGGRGGAVGCEAQARAAFHDCRFEGNEAYGGGAVHAAGESAVILDRCMLIGNDASYGGGVELRDAAAATITDCTFYANRSYAWFGAGVTGWSSVPPVLVRTIIAFSPVGSAVEGPALLTDCDLFGNHHGDWVDEIADQYGVGCNMANDPYFCDAGAGDLTVDAESPCLPAHNDCGVRIGALGAGCDALSEATDQIPLLSVTACYPNPFNPHVTVAFSIGRDTHVEAAVFDLSGRSVARLADGPFTAGVHRLRWDGRDRGERPVPSGVYIVRLQTAGSMTARKVLLAR